MRLKILSLFVAIQALSFGLWSGLTHANPSLPSLPTEQQHAHVHPAPAEIISATSALAFASRNMAEEKRFLHAIKKNQIQTALQKLPQEHVDSVKNIILDYDAGAHRGLGGNSMIILRAVGMSTEELVGVLIHELAHNVDYAFLTHKDESIKAPFTDGRMQLYQSDPSVDFYRVSWLSNGKRKQTATNMDFVSGYAMSDPFEDFAESYAYYVLHNKDFKVMAAGSEALHAKYRFMKYEVFDGLEFDTGDGLVQEKHRPWDITILSYDLDQFLS